MTALDTRNSGTIFKRLTTTASVSSLKSPAAVAVSSTLSIASKTTSSDVPFFPDPTSYTSPPRSSEDTMRSHITKLVLVGLSSALAATLVISFVFVRLWHLRKFHRPYSEFFNFSSSRRSRANSLHSSASQRSLRSIPRTTGLPPVPYSARPFTLTPSMLYPTLSPSNLPLSYQTSSRPTRAADVDEGGRRGGTRDPDDGEFDDKDVLPAYDNVDGPPKYAELEMRARLQALASAGNERMGNDSATSYNQESMILEDGRERGRGMSLYGRSNASLSTTRSLSRSPSATSHLSLTHASNSR